MSKSPEKCKGGTLQDGKIEVSMGGKKNLRFKSDKENGVSLKKGKIGFVCGKKKGP